MNRISGRALSVLAAIALITVVIGSLQPPQPPRADEGLLARIFQLAVVASAAALLLFLATADWSQPRRILRPLAFPIAALALAFVLLYWLENLR